MSKRIIDNTLYRHVLSTINRALFLEYAIRATQARHPTEMRKLRELDLKIRQFWIEAGLKDVEINSDDFMDFAWDCIQIGHPLTHTQGRIIHPELMRIFNEHVPHI